MPILKIPNEFIPNVAYMPITFSVNGTLGSGFIYRNGEVKFNGVYKKGTIVTCSCNIIND
ncbi:hypothetical protein [Clostridium baratii]|uniref:hypothetical protein n=1 Tax=Clostridium baratii TaxID=1561 RepID=UPI0030CAA110